MPKKLSVDVSTSGLTPDEICNKFLLASFKASKAHGMMRNPFFIFIPEGDDSDIKIFEGMGCVVNDIPIAQTR